MRVIHVAPTAFGHDGVFGGGERYPLELARALASHVDCELVTFGPRAGVTREEGGLVVRVLHPIWRLHDHPAHPVALRTMSAVAGADVVHTHHMRSVPSRLAALARAARGRPAVVTDHGLGGGGWGGALPLLFRLFLTVSRHSAETLGVPHSKTRVVYGGADTARYAPVPGVDRAGVLFVGRITPHKGLDRLIEALPDGASLTVVGTPGHDPRPPESTYPDLVRALSGGRDVRFAGAVSDDELVGLYRSASVFVLPSVHLTRYGRHVAISELLGLSVIEAMASGTPVVCSRIGGLPEVVVDGETGFLVQPGDVDGLRDRISVLLSDADLARRMGDAGRDLVLERFTWDACARRCLDAYRELVGPA